MSDDYLMERDAESLERLMELQLCAQSSPVNLMILESTWTLLSPVFYKLRSLFVFTFTFFFLFLFIILSEKMEFVLRTKWTKKNKPGLRESRTERQQSVETREAAEVIIKVEVVCEMS